MKITLGVEETSYGSITVDVAKDATKEDIEIAAIEGIHDGMACWNKSYEKVTEVLDCEDSTVPCVSFDKFMESTPKDTQNAPSKLEKMTKKEREEAIQGLKNMAKQFRGYEPNEKMFDLAIEALEFDLDTYLTEHNYVLMERQLEEDATKALESQHNIQNTTNGDVIKALFPEIEVKEYPNDSKGLKISILKNGYISMGSGSIKKSWWNKLYERVSRITILESQPCEDCISRDAVLDLAYTINNDDSEPYKVVYVSDIINLPSVKPQQGWISCDERLPEEHTNADGFVEPSEEVLVCYDDGTMLMSRYWGNRKSKKESPETYSDWVDVSTFRQNPIAWMPMPKPYFGIKEQKEKEEYERYDVNSDTGA